MHHQSCWMLLQAFAEPSQQGAASASGGHEEASSADAAAPRAQTSAHLPGIGEQADAGVLLHQQQAMAHPQSANADAAGNGQAGVAMSTQHRQVDVQADQSQGPHLESSNFDLPGSVHDDDDPSNPDGKLMSLLMG